MIRLRSRWLSAESRYVDASRCSFGAGQWRDWRGTENDRGLTKCIFCKRKVRSEAVVVMPSICSTTISKAKRKRLEPEERANDQLMFEQYEINADKTKLNRKPAAHQCIQEGKNSPLSLQPSCHINPGCKIPTPTPSYNDPNARIKLRNKHQEHLSLRAYLLPRQ